MNMGDLVTIGGLQLSRRGDQHLIRDLDLARLLGYELTYDIRKLIARWEPEIGVVATVAKTSGDRGGRPSLEFWLTEEQALFIAVKSETPNAIAVTKQIIRVFQDAVASAHRVGGWTNDEVMARIFAPAPEDWEACFQESLVVELCRLDGVAWSGGRHPRYLRSTNRKIYDMVFTTDIGRELKRLNPNPKFGSNHSQQLNPEVRRYFQRQLDKVEAIARQSSGKAEFWTRMHREYPGKIMQIGFRGM
jgi:hypothetical protein